METATILIVIASVILSICWYGFRKMCPICHRWNGLKEIFREHHRTETRYRTETRTETYKDRNGKITRTKDKQVDVPYTVVYNKVTYKCKNTNCNEKVQLTIREGKYIQETGIIFLVCVALLFVAFNPDIIKSSHGGNITDTLSNSPNSSISTSVNSTIVTKVTDFIPNESTKEKNPENNGVTSTVSENYEKSEVNENSIELANKEEVVNQQPKITAYSDENLKRKLAIEMLARGKDVDEIADSTFLSKAMIRKLRRNNKND